MKNGRWLALSGRLMRLLIFCRQGAPEEVPGWKESCLFARGNNAPGNQLDKGGGGAPLECFELARILSTCQVIWLLKS
jgi:hypothetical protein